MVLRLSSVFAIACLVLATPSRSAADTMFDLTTAGASATINGAIYQQGDIQPAGVGVFNTFLRIQNDPTEQGFNTDFRPAPMDDKSDPQHTRSLLLSDVPTAQINGTTYRVFALGINQDQKQPQVSLDKVQVFLGSAPNLSAYPNLGTLVYDQGANWVKLDSSLSHGNGSSDMFLNIPDSAFTGSNQYVYLYSQFGVNVAISHGGFEEWGNGPTDSNNATPEPSSLALAGIGFAGCLGTWFVRRKSGRVAVAV